MTHDLLLGLIGDNIANMNTTGYKSKSLLFREVLVQTEQGDSMSYVEGYGTLRDTSDGPIRPTGNPLDVAISGPGYLVVATDDGDQYTRAGQLRLDEEGVLVNQGGNPVMDEDGKEIQFGDQTGEVLIAKDGTITAADGEQFKLAVVSFRNEQALEGAGDGLYKTDEVPEEVEDPSVLQGKLEGSNVVAIEQMTRMIEVQRAYESMQNMIKTDNELQTDAISRLGAVA